MVLLNLFICSNVICEATHVPLHWLKRYSIFNVTRMGSVIPSTNFVNSCSIKHFLAILYRMKNSWTQHFQRSYVRTAKTQISLHIRTGGSVFVFCLKMLWILRYPQVPWPVLQRLWSDCMDAQADLSLHRVHMQFCRKCCVPAHNINLGISKDHTGNLYIYAVS